MFEGMVADVQILVLLSLIIFVAGLWGTMVIYVVLRHFSRKSGRRSMYARY